MNVDSQKRQKLLLIVAGVGAGLLLSDWLIVSPLISGWHDRSERIASLTKSVTHGQQMLDRDRNLRSRWNSMRTNALPGAESAAEARVLKAFDDWSRKSRVNVNSIKPQWKHSGDDYMTLECRVDAAGNLAAITRFLYEVERDSLALKVDGLEMTARDGDSGQLTLALQVSGLFLNETTR